MVYVISGVVLLILILFFVAGLMLASKIVTGNRQTLQEAFDRSVGG